MAKKKWKKTLKKVGKAAAIAAALYGATKLGRGRKKSVADTAATEGIKWTPGPQIPDIHNYKKKQEHFDPNFLLPGSKEGGRVGAKHGGRTRKQFGGGLNRPVARPVGGTARRDMRSGYYPSDMGMRGGPMYKKGGRVKSMGIAKRGGGAAKR